MIYNQQRHIQLLKRSQDFKDQGKSFYKESPEESLELSSYNAAVEENIFWQQPYKVAELMQDFLNKKIDGQKFCGRVFGLRRNLMIASDKFLIQLSAGEVKDFQPDPRSKKLSGFLTYLYSEYEYFADAEDSEKKEFYDSIKNGFLNFQKALNEE